MPKPRIMFFHDGRHPLIYMYEPPMQKEEYEASVDELRGTPVEAIMFGLGDGRTVLHDTKVGELWGHNVDRWPHLVFHRAHRNAAGLIERGLDPLRIVCDRAHECGLLIYPTLLVQQGRADPGGDTRCSDFWWNHDELTIGAAGDLPPEDRTASFMDFRHAAVRDERFALIQETIDNYDIDGFELQLNYGRRYFHPNHVDEGREIMTEWIRRIHTALKRSDPDRELATRVPASVAGCYEIGLDVAEWIRLGLVDVLIGQTYAAGELLDQMADFRSLVEAARGSECRVHASIQSQVDSDRLGQANIQMIRAAACNYWAQGIDGLYLANWFGNWPYGGSFYEKLRELPHPDVMAPRDKQYAVPTETERHQDITGMLEPGERMQLPVVLSPGEPVEITFSISDDLPRWHTVGRVHQVLLRVRTTQTTERDRFRFRLNGQELPPDSLRTINRLYQLKEPRYRIHGYWFVFKLDADHRPRQGQNALEVTLVERDADVTPDIVLRDVEVETKYLLGKNAIRERESDLGDYEYVNQRRLPTSNYA